MLQRKHGRSGQNGLVVGVLQNPIAVEEMVYKSILSFNGHDCGEQLDVTKMLRPEDEVTPLYYFKTILAEQLLLTNQSVRKIDDGPITTPQGEEGHHLLPIVIQTRQDLAHQKDSKGHTI